MEAGPDGRHKPMGLQGGRSGEGRAEGLQQDGQVRREIRDRSNNGRSRTRYFRRTDGVHTIFILTMTDRINSS
eukprot:12691728-Heterocapsa_arctica.AAC.1